MIIEAVKRKYQWQLILRKKRSSLGKEVQKLELDLSKEDISSAQTKSDIDTWYQKQKSAENALPIMFVGDWGYSAGSRIKNYSRQGNIWKPQKHSLYTVRWYPLRMNITLHNPPKLGLITLVKKKSSPSMVLLCYNLFRCASQKYPDRDSLSALARYACIHL